MLGENLTVAGKNAENDKEEKIHLQYCIYQKKSCISVPIQFIPVFEGQLHLEDGFMLIVFIREDTVNLEILLKQSSYL